MKDSYYVLVNPETERLYTLEERRKLGLISWAEYEERKFKQAWREMVDALKAVWLPLFRRG